MKTIRSVEINAAKSHFSTLNDLSEKSRMLSIQLIWKPLASSIDLCLQIKQAHWNVKGPEFISLHELFDEIHEHFEEYSDLLAERTVQLGGVADGTLQVVAELSDLPKYPLGISSGPEHLRALARSVAYFGESARHAIAAADGIGDRVTSDIFTEIARGADKYLWMIEAHLQSKE